MSSKNIFRKYRINNQIRSPKLRVIDEAGKQLGVFLLAEAKKLAEERNLDLVEIAPKAEPPVAKIIDYGKFLYQEAKKEKLAKTKQKTTETKNLRIGLKTSAHDLELKAHQAEKFLTAGHRVKITIQLRGREKANRNFAKQRFEDFLQRFIEKGYKLEQPPKAQPNGFFAIIFGKSH